MIQVLYQGKIYWALKDGDYYRLKLDANSHSRECWLDIHKWWVKEI